MSLNVLAPDKELQDKFNLLKEKIEQYSCILIFLQKYTDLDAAGSSIGLLNLIKHNYTNKEIYLVGFDLKPNGIKVPEEYLLNKEEHIINDLNTLGISVDVCNIQQVKYKDYINKCTEFIIIDHHERHDLWHQLKEKPTLINCNLYGSCCGLLFKIAKYNKWDICKDVLCLLIKGHHGDTRTITGIPGVWEIFYEIQNMGVDVSEQVVEVNRHPLYMVKAFHDVLCGVERDGGALIFTWTRNMCNKYTYLQKSLFTFPLMYLHFGVKANTLIYFHHLLRETPKQMTIKNIFVAIIKENPELEELLLENGFSPQRKWFYKRGDVMEFKELFNANRELFVR